MIGHFYKLNSIFFPDSVLMLMFNIMCACMYAHFVVLFLFCCLGDCIGASLVSTKRSPVIPSYGLQELTGMVLCNDSTCDKKAGVDYHQLTKLLYPEASTEVYIPKSRVFFSSENIDSILQFMPSPSYDELFFDVDKFKFVEPSFGSQCNDLSIAIETSQRLSLFTATIRNTGKVCPS